MKVVIFSGTTEGRALSRAVAALGIEATVCVATELGAEEQGRTPGITVCTGRLDADAMAAAAVGVEYHRLLRPASDLPAGSVVLQTAAQAAAYLAGKPGNILLATGAKELPAFAPLDPARLYPRVLPTLAGITACETAGIPHRNIIAMQGPFTRELNVAVMRQFHIAYMVTKDGGAAGGFAEKVQAAQSTGAQLVVLRRPPEQGQTAQEILNLCKEKML